MLSRFHLITKNQPICCQSRGFLMRIKEKLEYSNYKLIRRYASTNLDPQNGLSLIIQRNIACITRASAYSFNQNFTVQTRLQHNISGSHTARSDGAAAELDTEAFDLNKILSNKIVPGLNDGPKQIYYDEADVTVEDFKSFANPKNKLHNYYSVLAQELDKKSLEVSPNFKSVKGPQKSTWICTYHIRWPEDIKFMAKDITKVKASNKAALAALMWLKRQNKMTENLMPLIYDKEAVKKISKKTLPLLDLNEYCVHKIKTIADIHDNKFAPYILENSQLDAVENGEIDFTEPDDINFKRTKTQKYLGLDKYLAKEKVKLPIADYKQEFIDLLSTNQVVIVKGQPGCGKSTRIPQYVLEAWATSDGLSGKPGRIVVTQPRRIAAISLSQRVCNERDEMVGNIVGYQVRLNSNFQSHTGRVLYCTTGILLRHLQSDPKLSSFTHVILDEAHERDVNTDLLMNLMRNAVKENPELKLVVMSATIDTDVFSEYYGGVPVLEIPGFTYPVEQHFLEDCKVKLPKTLEMCDGKEPAVVHDEVIKLLKYIHETQPDGAILCFLPGWEDISKIYRNIPQGNNIAVYCLHSRLQDSEQWKIFSRPPPGVRKIILATNIAETSVTIDDVVYVVDTGIHKDMRFDADKGVNCIDNHWISKASATQRKGRAGRVQPGVSYHLYSKSKYDSFLAYTMPEIMRTSLTKIVLDSKILDNNTRAIDFMGQLLTPPNENSVVSAVEELQDLELLDANEKLTTLGRTLAGFQLEPKLSKAMVHSVIFKCATPIVDIVTMFSSETELFISGLLDKDGVKRVKKQFSTTSDHLAMMRLFEKWLEIYNANYQEKLEKFCDVTQLVPHKMKTVNKLRDMHFGYLYKGLYDVMPIADDFSDNDEIVKAVLFSGVGNVLLYRNWDIVKNVFKKNRNVLLTRNRHKATIASESVNFKRDMFPSNFLMYINETRSNIRRTTLVRECSLIPEISVVLFSNKNLLVKEVDDDLGFNPEEKVKLALENTSIELICDRELAKDIVRCKNALNSFKDYFIRQLTSTGERNDEVNKIWDTVLNELNVLLDRSKITEGSSKTKRT